MCLMCNCPQPVPPPNQKIAKCRKMLQILAGSLLLIGVIGLFCNFAFDLLYDLLLIYMLFIAWTTFNWCMTLMFFLFCTMQTIQSVIFIVGLLEYNQFFSAKKNILISLYCLLSVIYYPLAVYVSHYCYKYFKNQYQGNNQIFPQNNQNNQNNNQGRPNQNQQNYQRIRQNQNINRQQNRNNFFQGQGVRIG